MYISLKDMKLNIFYKNILLAIFLRIINEFATVETFKEKPKELPKLSWDLSIIVGIHQAFVKRI